MRAPGFWGPPPERPDLRARLLSPLGRLTARATARRVARPPEVVPDVPVICVGNLNAGGTGKTPTVIALVQHLMARGLAVHVLSRGYGGSEAGPLQVNGPTAPRRWATSRCSARPLPPPGWRGTVRRAPGRPRPRVRR